MPRSISEEITHGMEERVSFEDALREDSWRQREEEEMAQRQEQQSGTPQVHYTLEDEIGTRAALRVRISDLMLIFRDPTYEQQFEGSWCEPGLLVQPLLAYHILWFIDFLTHKSVAGAPRENLAQIGMSASSLSVPLLTTLCCCYRQTAQWVRHHYHTILIANVTTVMLFVLSCGLWDQFNLPPTLLCPQAFYACPHHVLDVNSINTTWFSLAFINVFSACLVKYKIAANLLIVVIFLTGALAGYHPNVVSGAPPFVVHLVLTTLVIAVGTFYVGYKGEQSFRQSLISRVMIKRRNEAFESVLTKMLPPRLLHKSFTVPLLEHFKGVSVMFCSFDKKAVEKMSEQDFFDEIENIFAIFDDVVEQSGCFKLEQVGEDYVVVTSNVMTAEADEDVPEAHQLACIKITNLARDLVEIGNRHVSSRTRKICGNIFKFKSGVHFGPVSAGILGRSRKFYRLFGDTVVMSARMAQHTAPGSVQVSEAAHLLMGDGGPPRCAGKLIEAKGKGSLMAYVLGESTHPHILKSNASPGSIQTVSLESYRCSPAASQSATTSKSLSYKRRAMLGFVELPNFNELEGDPVCDEDIEIILDEKQSRALLSLYQERSESAKVVLTEQLSRLSHENATSSFFYTGRMSKESGNDRTSKDSAHVPMTFSPWTGRFKDHFQELEYCKKFEHRLRLKSMHYINCSRAMAVILFTSVATLGQNTDWTAPAGIAGTYQGRFIDTGDVKITLWMGVIQVILMILSLLIPPALARRADGSYVSSAAQCTIFGCGCLAAMACTPSVLSLGIPMAFLAQVACAHMDILVAISCTLPIMILCFAEAYYSGKLVTWIAISVYAVFMIGTLGIVLYHQAKNEAENRRDWRASQELRIEKEVMEIILLDMLPKPYAIRLLNNMEMRSTEGKSVKAIVLFGDLRGYTGLAQTLGPDRIAMVMHGMWCVFDALVQKHRMHKMDTVGDAFIVCGLVEDDDSNLVEQACSMADLAREMIIALKNISAAIDTGTEWWKSFDSQNPSKIRNLDELEIGLASKKEAPVKGKVHPVSLFQPKTFQRTRSKSIEPEDWDQKLKMRIGVDVGMVVAGVLGKLQPRFHMHGPVVHQAQLLEQRCLCGSVLVSKEMARVLQIKAPHPQVGHCVPFPLRTYVFPHLGLPPPPPPQGNAGIIHSFLTLTGLKIPAEMRQAEWDQLKGSHEMTQAENILEQLEQFVFVPLKGEADRSARAGEIQLYVELQDLPAAELLDSEIKPAIPKPAALPPLEPAQPARQIRRRSLVPVSMLSPVVAGESDDGSVATPLGAAARNAPGSSEHPNGENPPSSEGNSGHHSFTFMGAGTHVLGQPLLAGLSEPAKVDGSYMGGSAPVDQEVVRMGASPSQLERDVAALLADHNGGDVLVDADFMFAPPAAKSSDAELDDDSECFYSPFESATRLPLQRKMSELGKPGSSRDRRGTHRGDDVMSFESAQTSWSRVDSMSSASGRRQRTSPGDEFSSPNTSPSSPVAGDVPRQPRQEDVRSRTGSGGSPGSLMGVGQEDISELRPGAGESLTSLKEAVREDQTDGGSVSMAHSAGPSQRCSVEGESASDDTVSLGINKGSC